MSNINIVLYSCRFDFPKDVEGFDYVTEPGQNSDIITAANFNHEKMEKGAIFVTTEKLGDDSLKRDLHLARNHPNLNEFNKAIGLGFSSNTDIKLIKSYEQLVAYVNKYLTKSEGNSLAHHKVLKGLSSKLNDDMTVRSGLIRTAIKANNREFSRQEAFLMASSDKEFVNFSLPSRLCSLSGNKSIQLDIGDPNAKATNDSGFADIYHKRNEDENFKAACQKYEENPEAWVEKARKIHPSWRQPTHPKNVSLHFYLAYFKKNWELAPTEYFPIVTPHFSRNPNPNNKEGYENFCKIKLLQFKPGSNPTNVLEGFSTHAECFADFVKNNEFCPQLMKDFYETAMLNETMGEIGQIEEEDHDMENGENYGLDNALEELYPDIDTDFTTDPAYRQEVIDLNQWNDYWVKEAKMAEAHCEEEGGIPWDQQSDRSDYDDKDFKEGAKEVDWSESFCEMGLDDQLILVRVHFLFLKEI